MLVSIRSLFRSTVLLLCILLASACRFPVTEPAAPADDQPLLHVYVLDCGQGDSIFLDLPNGQTMLVDASISAQSQDIVRFLQERNVTRLDYLVATHPHADHIGGMTAVVEAFDIGAVWLPDVTTNTQTFENLLDAIESKNLDIDIAEPGAYWVGDASSLLSVRCLGPINPKDKDLNNASIVLRVVYGDHAVLLTGDMETAGESAILSAGYDVSASVLKLGHHGSNTSTSAAFLRAVSPVYAVASCGADNKYGHPHAEITALLQREQIPFYRTDADGTVVISTDGRTLTVRAIGK